MIFFKSHDGDVNMGVSKNRGGISPQIICHYLKHPLSGTSIFGNTHINDHENMFFFCRENVGMMSRSFSHFFVLYI